MAYILLDDGFAEHPKIEALRPGEVVAHLKAMCWAARRGTDGHIPPQTLKTLGITKAQVDRFVAVGVWDVNSDGWVIHDWTDFNPPSDPEERRRWHDRKRQRMRRQGGAGG